MRNVPTIGDLQAEDDAYENAPLQFSADRMSELVRTAENDPSKQVTVHASTMNKLYLAFIGVLEVYQTQTAAGTVICGKRYLCSVDLRDAIAPIIDESRRNQVKKDIDREIELMTAFEATQSNKEISSTAKDADVVLPSKLH